MNDNKDWLGRDRFQSGIFWELYRDLENQFLDFLGYVPYLEGNEKVYSFRLLNLILSVGGHVDSAFKEMARYEGFKDNADCQKILRKLRKSESNIKAGKPPITIPTKLSLKAFEKEYEISKRKVAFKRLPEREFVTPFEPYNPETNAPEWWEIYNGLKHDVGINVKEANVENTRNALAGAFLLNVCHIPAAVRLDDYGVVKHQIRAWEGYGKKIKAKWSMPQGIFRNILEKKQPWPAIVETPLFIYNYDNR